MCASNRVLYFQKSNQRRSAVAGNCDLSVSRRHSSPAPAPRRFRSAFGFRRHAESALSDYGFVSLISPRFVHEMASSPVTPLPVARRCVPRRPVSGINHNSSNSGSSERLVFLELCCVSGMSRESAISDRRIVARSVSHEAGVFF
jgi:hypothetical protein